MMLPQMPMSTTRGCCHSFEAHQLFGYRGPAEAIAAMLGAALAWRLAVAAVVNWRPSLKPVPTAVLEAVAPVVHQEPVAIPVVAESGAACQR